MLPVYSVTFLAGSYHPALSGMMGRVLGTQALASGAILS